MRIQLLVIESENRFRLNLSHRLHGEGVAVAGMTRQADVVFRLTRNPADVVLLVMDGSGRESLALIRQIKSVSPLTEIIMINDTGNMDLSIEGMKLGAFDDFLMPVDIDALVTRIREAGARKEKNKKSVNAPNNPKRRGGKQL